MPNAIKARTMKSMMMIIAITSFCLTIFAVEKRGIGWWIGVVEWGRVAEAVDVGGRDWDYSECPGKWVGIRDVDARCDVCSSGMLAYGNLESNAFVMN